MNESVVFVEPVSNISISLPEENNDRIADDWVIPDIMGIQKKYNCVWGEWWVVCSVSVLLLHSLQYYYYTSYSGIPQGT